MQRKDREESLEKIKTSSRYNTILVSIKSGAVGLNLTCCSNVILLGECDIWEERRVPFIHTETSFCEIDLWWNPAIEVCTDDALYACAAD